MRDLIVALSGVVVGAFATAGAQHFFWRVQHREMLSLAEQQKRRRAQAVAAERLQQLGSQTIDLATDPLSGPNIDKTQVTIQTYVELLRLQRELRSFSTSVRELFSDQRQQQLSNFQRNLSQVRAASPEVVDTLRTELEHLYSDLRRDISTSPMAKRSAWSSKYYVNVFDCRARTSQNGAAAKGD